jgi:hypothetical protein
MKLPADSERHLSTNFLLEIQRNWAKNFMFVKQLELWKNVRFCVKNEIGIIFVGFRDFMNFFFLFLFLC